MIPITIKTLKITFQGSRKEITRAYQLVTLLIDQLHKIHSNAHVEFYIYIKCSKKAMVKGNTLESLRKTSDQVHHSNIELATQEY